MGAAVKRGCDFALSSEPEMRCAHLWTQVTLLLFLPSGLNPVVFIAGVTGVAVQRQMQRFTRRGEKQQGLSRLT